MEIFAFCVITFQPIINKTCLAPQNDRQNLSFVKATNVVGEKMAGNTCKIAISYLCQFRFETEFTAIAHSTVLFSADARVILVTECKTVIYSS